MPLPPPDAGDATPDMGRSCTPACSGAQRCLDGVCYEPVDGGRDAPPEAAADAGGLDAPDVAEVPDVPDGARESGADALDAAPDSAEDARPEVATDAPWDGPSSGTLGPARGSWRYTQESPGPSHTVVVRDASVGGCTATETSPGVWTVSFTLAPPSGPTSIFYDVAGWTGSSPDAPASRLDVLVPELPAVMRRIRMPTTGDPPEFIRGRVYLALRAYPSGAARLANLVIHFWGQTNPFAPLIVRGIDRPSPDATDDPAWGEIRVEACPVSM